MTESQFILGRTFPIPVILSGFAQQKFASANSRRIPLGEIPTASVQGILRLNADARVSREPIRETDV